MSLAFKPNFDFMTSAQLNTDSKRKRDDGPDNTEEDEVLFHSMPSLLEPDKEVKLTKGGAIKGLWTKEEDDKLSRLVAEYGPKKWAPISAFIPGRVGKQCRERWFNHLDPSVKKEAWTPQEDRTIINVRKEHGNRWTLISKLLPGRSENAVKNRWNSTMRKRLTIADGGVLANDSPLAINTSCADEDLIFSAPQVGGGGCCYNR